MATNGLGSMHTSMTLDGRQFINGLDAAQRRASRFGREMNTDLVRPLGFAERAIFGLGSKIFFGLTGVLAGTSLLGGLKKTAKAMAEIAKTQREMGRDAAINKALDMGLTPTATEFDKIARAGEGIDQLRRSFVRLQTSFIAGAADIVMHAKGISLAIGNMFPHLNILGIGAGLKNTFAPNQDDGIRKALKVLEENAKTLEQRMEADRLKFDAEWELLSGQEKQLRQAEFTSDGERLREMKAQIAELEKQLDKVETGTSRALGEPVLTRRPENKDLRGDFGFRRISELDATGRMSPELKPLNSIKDSIDAIKMMMQQWYSWYQRRSSDPDTGVRLV